MASLRDRLLEQARKQDIQAGVADPNRFAPPAPVLQDNPTPFTADYSPTPAPAPVQTPTEYKVSRDGFAMDEELGAKYGSYENYLSNVVTTQYKQNLESQAQPVKFKYKDLNTDAVQTQIANSKAANAELKSESFRSEDVEAAQMGMTVAEYRDFQRRKYELDEKARAAEVSAAPVTAARDSRDKIQDELNYLSKANYGAGNIDLSATPRFENGDGTYTYYGGMVYNDPATGYALLIPTSAKIDGQWTHLDQAQAIEQYRRTGRYLGAFKTATEAMAYSNQLHEQQEQLFNRRAELSAQYKTNDELYQQLYNKFQSDTLDPLNAETDRFAEQYDPVSYYKDKGTSYSEILSVIEGLDEILKTVPAGSSEYVSAKRRRDLLNYNKLKFATMDELMNIYGTKATDEEKKAIDARLAELVRMGVDPMSDPEYQALTTKASADRVAAANEIANRDALHTVQVLDNAGPTKAGKLVEALSTYAQTGKLPDDLAQTIKAATGKSNLGTLGDLYNLTKKELEKAGFSPREAKNTVEVLQRQGNAERNEIRMQKITDFATDNVVSGTAATAASFLTNLLSPVGVVEGVRTLLNQSGGPTLQSADPNSGWFFGTNATNAIRSGITEAVNGPTFNIGSHKVDVFDTAYGILTSGVDSMIASHLPGGLGGFMLGASAAAQTLQEEAERGTPIGEALLTATAAGVFEGLFENWSIGNFRALKETTAVTYGEVLKNIGKSFITNMEEEAATELANVVFDVLRNSQYSNFNRDIAELMTTINPKTGKVYTKQEAQNKVIGNLAYQVGEAGITGGLQGVLMGGVASAASIRGIHTLNQLYKLDRQQKGLFANLVIGSQFKQGSETRAWSDEYLPRIKSLIDSNASAAEKKPELVSLLAEIQSKSGDIINTMNRERVRYGPTGFTEPMHRAVVDGVENDKPATLHVETPTETRIREAQTAAGMSQETIDATKALLFDIASGKDADDIRFRGVDKNVLTGMQFRGVVENITGSKVFGRTAAEVRQSLTDIAHRINSQSIDINKTDVEETPQEDLVPPTETPMEEQAEAQPETQPESPANWYNTDAQAATEATKREPRTTPSNIPLDNLIRNDWYSEKPSGNNLPKSDWYAGQAQSEGPTQATTPNGPNPNDLTRQSWYGDQATTEAQTQPEAPAQTEPQTEAPAEEKSAAAANTQQAGTGEDEKKSKPKKEKSKARKIMDRILHGTEANTEANTEADDEPSLEVVGRTETNAETGSHAAAEVTVDIGGEQVTEAEFVADSIRGGKITEAQAREAFRRLANNESIPDDVRESIADIHEEGRVERGAAEQGITESQYLTQEVLNILLADKNITVKFVPGDEMPGQNGRMDHETGTLYINANADEADTRGLSGIAWVLGHEIFHAGDQAYRDSHPEETAKIKSLTDSVLGYTKDGEFVPGVMQRLASVGALGGKYASMANNAEELQQQVDELKARYKEFLLQPGREQAYVDKHLTDADKSDPTKLQERIEALRAEYQQLINDTVTDDYIREEIAGDFVGTLLGFNAYKPGAKLKRIDLLRTLAGIDAEPLKAAQLSLRDRLQEKRISGLRGKAFREAFDTMQRESHDLMNDITTALDSYEPGKVKGVRESISSLAFSMGIDAERDPDTHEISYKIGGQSVDHVTKDHVKNHSGVGVMIRIAEESGNIKPEEANRQYQAMADLMNNIMKTQDPELYWNWAGATIFSAIRSNSDPQYSTTVDFSTVCRKTQDMLTAVSAAMMERAKQNPDGYGGLTKDEITNLQAKVNEANLPVPCPVCYVFSRWAGAGGILDNINRLQRKFGSMSQEEMTAQRNNLEQQMIDRGLAKKTKKGDYQFSRDNIDALVKEKAATVDKLEGEQAKLESLARLGQDTEESRNRLEAIAADLQQLKSDLDLLGEWQWVKNVATNPEYKPVPDYVLYNLDDGETFARDYNVVWGWRTTRGSGAGKAILPYSDMRLGDFFVGAKKGSSADESNSDTDAVLFDNSNAFTSAAYGQDRLNADQKKLMASALKRVAAQNLIGGQRLQSTSDFRYEYALDYLQTFLEMQALGSKAQTYTKVREFVDIICSVGGDCNMSVMPKGKGYDNGKLVFSNVTGMDIKAALDANRRFDNAQLILVGINDTHIELALEDSEETGGIDIGFVIPYHTSGASIEGFISELVQNLGERINTKRDYWDYTKLQSDSIIKEQRLGADGKLHWEDARTDAQIALTALRKHLLTERNGNKKWKPTAAERQEIYDALARGNKDILGRSFDDLRETELKALAGDPKAIAEYKSWTQANVAKLYQRLWESDGQDYGTRLNSAQAEHIMPYEYWDTRTTRANAYINGFLFRSYCYNLGLRPRFTGWSSDGGRMTKTFTDDNGTETTQEYGDFSNSTGYWKTLIDRPMYDNNGNYREQQAINLTDFNQDMLNKEYAQNFPETYRARENDFEKATQVGRAWSENNQWREGVGTKEALEGMSEERKRAEAPDRKTRYSLANARLSLASNTVINPSDDNRGKWTPSVTTDWIRDRGFDLYGRVKQKVEYDKNGNEIVPNNPTQTNSTIASYRKYFELLRQKHPDSWRDLRVLDASSGMGHGTQLGRDSDFNVTDIEPFPAVTIADGKYLPKMVVPKGETEPRPAYRTTEGVPMYAGEDAYQQAIDNGEKFDVILSNAVLNVVPQDQRNDIVLNLKKLLAPGGEMFINVRSLADLKSIKWQETPKNNSALDEAKTEWFVGDTKAYQKFFGPEEFVAYMQDALGPGYEVNLMKKNNPDFKDVQRFEYEKKMVDPRDFGSAVVVHVQDKRNGANQRMSLSQITPEQQVYRDKNLANSNVGSRLYTLKGSNIERYKGNVGKFIDNTLYIHKNYLQEKDANGNYLIPQDLLEAAKKLLPEDFQYNTVAYNKKDGTIRFDEAPDFDTSPEPIPGKMIKVNPATGDVTPITKGNDYIWHHKWQWVKNDYDGFDVSKSWEWSKRWLNELRATDDKVSNRGVSNGSGHGDANWRKQLEYFGLPTRPNATERYSISVADQEPGRNYKMPEGYGAFIRNTSQHYVDRIFSDNEAERKTVETRKDRTLDAFLHKRMPIIDTAKHQVIGDVYVEDVIQYDNPDDFNADYNRHWVPKTDKNFGWTDGEGTRYGYVLSDPQKYDTPIPLDEGYRKQGRIGAELPEVLRRMSLDQSDDGRNAELEQEYQDALDANDPDWQAQLVNQAAYNAGYTTGAYHGSPITDIDVFNTRTDRDKPEKLQLLFGSHFTRNKDFANLYASKAKNSKGTSRMTTKRGRVYDVYLDLGKSLDLVNPQNYTAGEEIFNLYEDLPTQIKKKVPLHTFTAADAQYGVGAEGEKFINTGDIEKALQLMSPKEATEFLVDHGYNSLEYLAAYNTGSWDNNRFSKDPSIIMLDPEKIKSADPVTYDNDGKVIPLSERFNRNENRIRYSLSQNNGDGKYASREQQIQDIVTRMMNANPDNHTLWNDSALSTERMPISKSQINNDSGFRQDRDAVNFPRKSENKKVAMRATQTIANSGLTDARAARMIEEATKDGVWSYIPESNDSATDWAKQEISDKDWGGAYGSYLDSVNKGLSSKKLTALGIQLYNDAIKRQDYYAAMDVASLIIRNAHEAGAALQAMNMLGKLNADGKLYMMMKGINNITDYYKKLYPDAKIRIDDALVKAYQKAVQSGDKAAINAAQAAIEKTVASQIPATWKDRVNNWRYFSMLANPTTHLRNVFGNFFFAPFRLMKQATKAGLERVFMGKTGADSNRTTALLNLTSKEDRDRFAAALKDASNVMDLIQSGGKQTGPKDRIENMRQIALTKTLDKVMKGNTWLLDKEDVLFSSPAYAEALASFMKARGISAADYANGKISEELKTAAQKHAIKEAQKATYRDHNAFSDAIANIGQRGRSKQAGPGDKVLTTATEAILPFKRTPANIMARAWEYSPAELVTIAFSDIGKLTKAGTALREAQEESDGSLDARRRIQQAEEALADVKSNMFDHIASASVGSVVLMLGMLFRHRGWVIGSDDDDEEQAKFDKLVGGQEYALRDEAGNTYTIDWLAPEILPFFAGVAMYDKLIDRKKGEGGILGDIKNVAMSLYEPMLNMSMLSSLNDMLANQKYVEDNEQVSYLAKRVAASFVSQFFPTVFGKIENLTEDKKYTTYINKQSPLGKDEQYNVASIMNKLPGEYNQIINYDAWGREQSTGNIARRIAQNLLSPGYYKANASTPYDEELQRLKDLGYDKVLPTKVSQSQKVNEEYMTAEEYELFTKTMGQEQYKLIGQLLGSSGYKRLSDKDKADAVRDMYKDAKQAAENAVLRMRGGESKSKIKKTSAEKAGLSPTTYVVAYSVYDNATTPSGYNATDSGNTPTWAKMLAVINNSSISNADKLKFVNGKSGRDEEFKTLDDAKAYYEKSKEKAKK